MDLLVGSVVTVGWEDDQAPVDWESFELDGKPDTLFIGERRADLGPATGFLAGAFEFFDGEDVEVGGIATGCSNGRSPGG